MNGNGNPLYASANGGGGGGAGFGTSSRRTSRPSPASGDRGVRFSTDSLEQNRRDDEGHNNRDDNSSDSPSLMDLVGDVATAGIAIGCLAGLMTILVVLYVTVRPFSRSTYRRLSCAWGLAPFLDAVSLLLPGTRLCWTGDSDVPSPIGSAVLVANHVVAADWWALFLLGRCVGLQGTLKVFLRNEYLHLNMEDVAVVGEPGARAAAAAAAASNGSSSSLATMSSSNTTAKVVCPTPSNGHHSTSTIRGRQRQPHKAAPDLALMAKLLHLFLEFPLIDGESSDREQLSALLRSFANSDSSSNNNTNNNSSSSTPSVVHLLHYPEGWCNHNDGAADRQSVHARSNQFAKLEGKPVLKHLLLPRTRGFHASLECLRESRPVIFDVTMAYRGYDGSLPPLLADFGMPTLWRLLRRKFPREVHLRIKRYSMEEVLQDSNWLVKKWAEKDRLLAHFARHQQFPVDSRGYGRHRVFDTRTYSLETSIMALIKLLLMPCCVPLLLLISFPLFWTLLVLWCGQRAVGFLLGADSAHGTRSSQGTADNDGDSQPGSRSGGAESQTPGSAASLGTGTPYLPATPFASPSLMNWRDIFSPSPTNTGRDDDDDDDTKPKGR